MANPSKARGSSWEKRVVEALNANGWPHAERRALSGALDKGDVSGVIGVCIEAKDHRTLNFSGWLKELEVEMKNAGAQTGAVWAKRRGCLTAEDGYVMLTGRMYMKLLKEAGY